MAGSGRLTERVAQLVGGRRSLVALSGGADSGVLAWAACLAEGDVRAAHVHHGQASSDDLARAAVRLAERLDLDLTIHHVAVPEGGSFETAARTVRYRTLFDELADDEILLVGHTRDDQSETVVMRLARGAGPSGLAAMRLETDRIVRPLLEFSRAEVRQVAIDSGLPFLDDPANDDPTYSRVVVRNEILPRLEQLQPGAGAALASHAVLAQELDDALDGLAKAALVGRRLSLSAYRSMGSFLQRRALRILVTTAGRLPPGSDALERMHAVARGEARSAEIGEGFEVSRNGAFLEVFRACLVPARPTVLEGGSVQDWGRWRFDSRLLEGRPPAWPLELDRAVFPVSGRLTIRAVRSSDSIGSRSVFDAMGNVAAHARRSWPLVELDGTMAWVPGIRRFEVGWIGPADDGYRWLLADRRDEWTSERS